MEIDIKDQVEDLIKMQIDEYIESCVTNFLQKTFSEKDLFSGEAAKIIRDYASRYTNTEIGNRLRCGLYDNSLFKKVFEENWEPRFTEQIRNEVQKVIGYEVDKAVKEKIKKILGN